MGFPALGMTYEQVNKRLKGHLGKDPAMVNSLLRQAKLHEGEGAVSELIKENYHDNHSTNRLGYNPKYAKNYETIRF